MLPEESVLTFKTSPSIDPVNGADTAAIELPVVTAATGNFLLSAACITVAAAEKLWTAERFIDAV